jgi:hypothetical protein
MLEQQNQTNLFIKHDHDGKHEHIQIIYTYKNRSTRVYVARSDQLKMCSSPGHLDQ